jgi:hypothetical protein
MIVAAEIDISKSPAAVFPWISDPEKAMQWQKNVKTAEIIEGGPGVVGTQFMEILSEQSGELEVVGTITDYIENKLMGFHLESRIHVVDVIYRLDGREAYTRLCTEAIVEWKFPMNLISLVRGQKMRRNLSSELSDELNTLKQICESS